MWSVEWRRSVTRPPSGGRGLSKFQQSTGNGCGTIYARMGKVSIRFFNDPEIRAVWEDIGTRVEAEGRNYTAHNLNRYTAIDTFTPTYDLDGNQTKILTSTGECADVSPFNLAKAFDGKGRIVSFSYPSLLDDTLLQEVEIALPEGF